VIIIYEEMFTLLPSIVVLFISFGLVYVWPVYATLKTLQTLSKSDSGEGHKTQWISYWVFHALIQYLETYVLVFFAQMIPLYPELRLIGYAILVLPGPQFMGSRKLWIWADKHCGELLRHPLVDEYKKKAVTLVGELRSKLE